MKSKLIEEGGVTDNSLYNAEVLVKDLGIPDSVALTYIDEPWDYLCTAVWGETSFVFSGFSWGYFGEGPKGLATFIASIDTSKDVGEFIKTIGNLDKELTDFTVFERKR
jgi:hypothetical protein